MREKRYFTTKQMIFMAICCDLGIIVKKLIGPLANIITDNLHIPGGISSAVSLSFIVIAAVMVNRFGAAMIMSIVQCAISVSITGGGSMGAYSILAYFVPGMIIDCVVWVFYKLKIGRQLKCFTANVFGSISTCLIANSLVFRLRAVPLVLYCSIGAFSGALSGYFAIIVVDKLKKIIPHEITGVSGRHTR